jgi:hypothetical protein
MKTLIALGVIGVLVSGGLAWSGSNDNIRALKLDVAPVTDSKYQEECGACHFAYQPGLLPARSWQLLLENLADHFGENAELAEADVTQLRVYLTENAAEQARYKRSQALLKSIPAQDTPLRISETLYFKRKHAEIPARLVTDNAEVGSFSRCDACHTQAARGSYDEHAVSIPGLGRWND